MKKVELTGDIGKPMITLHGSLDTLLPIKTDSDVYSRLIKQSGNGKVHRYYTVEEGITWTPSTTASPTGCVPYSRASATHSSRSKAG